MNDPLDSYPSPARSRGLAILVAAHLAALVAIVLAMTPYTYILDAVKQVIFLCAGPVLLMLAVGAIFARQAPAPERGVTLGLVAYGAVLLVSTLTSRYRWIGWWECLMFVSAAGFFMAGFGAGTSQRASTALTRGLALILLAAVLVGFFMFDFTLGGQHHSGVGWLGKKIIEKHTVEGMVPYGPWYNLLRTLMFADTELQSTILNRDFFSGFCLLLLPFALLLALEPGAGRGRWAWRAVGYLTALGALSCILGNADHLYQLGLPLVVLGAFCFLAFRAAPADSAGARGAVLALAVTLGVWIALNAFLIPKRFPHWLHSPTPFTGLDSLRIIWSGALKVFRDFPILGGGPGTFRIYFVNHRDPEYYNFGVNSVTTLSHNHFLDVLSETGLLGLAAFLILLGALLAPALRWMRRHPDPRLRLALLAAATAVLAMFAFSMTSPFSQWVIGIAPLWSVMGLLAGLNTQARRAEAPADAASLTTQAARRAPTLLAPVALGAAFALALAVFPSSISCALSQFRAECRYAIGLNWLENANHMMTDRNAGPEQIEYGLNKAVDGFEATLREDPTFVSAYYKVGSAYCSLSQLADARAAGLKKKNQLEEAGRRQEVADRAMKQSLDAYLALERLWPDYAEIHYNFGIVYGQIAERLRARYAVTHDPALLRQAEEDEKKATTHLERMVRLAHKSEVAQLAATAFIRIDDHRRAFAILKAASDREPSNFDLASRYLAEATILKDAQAEAQARQRMMKNK